MSLSGTKCLQYKKTTFGRRDNNLKIVTKIILVRLCISDINFKSVYLQQVVGRIRSFKLD